jgi:N-acetylmuramoyl-L-alanine amidase
MTFQINKHYLVGEQVEVTPIKGKDSGTFGDNLPDTIVLHYTALPSVEEAVAVLHDPQIQASAHLAVGRDGRVRQLLPFNKIAWHAGKSSWQGRSGLNQYSIGIEMGNAGRLIKIGASFQAWWGGIIEAEQVFFAMHRNESVADYWHAYSEAQIQAVVEICRLLKRKYAIKTVIGHEEIAPLRKSDPGPAFPLDQLRLHFFEDSSDNSAADESLAFSATAARGVVNAARLNIRRAPREDAEIEGLPLTQNTLLDILEEQNGWLKVRAIRTGWVKREFVQKV